MIRKRVILRYQNENADKVIHELLHILPEYASRNVCIVTTISEHATLEYLVPFLHSLKPTEPPQR